MVIIEAKLRFVNGCNIEMAIFPANEACRRNTALRGCELRSLPAASGADRRRPAAFTRKRRGAARASGRLAGQAPGTAVSFEFERRAIRRNNRTRAQNASSRSVYAPACDSGSLSPADFPAQRESPARCRTEQGFPLLSLSLFSLDTTRPLRPRRLCRQS